MQLHWGWAVIAALALGAALVWWMQPADDSRGRAVDTQEMGAGRPAQSDAEAGPTLYRWVDAGGVVNITDKPPVGRPYKIVHINPNRNIVPMGRAGIRE